MLYDNYHAKPPGNFFRDGKSPIFTTGLFVPLSTNRGGKLQGGEAPGAAAPVIGLVCVVWGDQRGLRLKNPRVLELGGAETERGPPVVLAVMVSSVSHSFMSLEKSTS